MPHIESIQRLAEMGLEALEIICEYPEDIDELENEREFSILMRLREQHGLTYYVHAPWVDLNAASLNEAIRKETVRQWRKSIEFAARLGSPLITVHLGHSYSQDRLRQSLEKAITSIKQVAETADAHEVVLSVENVGQRGSQLFRTADDLVNIFEKVDIPPVGMTFDIGHAFIQGLDIRDCLRKLFKRITHIHIHDNLGSNDDHLPLHLGSIDFDAIFEELRRIKYDSGFGIELGIRCFPVEALQWSIDAVSRGMRTM